MAAIPQKIQSRITDGLKKLQPIIESAKIRDVNESDTVVLLTGILSDILGYDKYTDITTEFAIRGTFCDLAIKIDGKLTLLLEAKAIGIELKEQHVKQAVDYAANKGVEWVILTNSVNWKVYKIIFSKPIQNILVLDIDLLKINPKSSESTEVLYFLCKEAVSKFSLDNFYTQKQATNKFMIGNLLFEEGVLNTIRRELKEVYPDIKVSPEEIAAVLKNEIIKREILEGEEADEARKKINKANRKKDKQKAAKEETPAETTSSAQTAEAQNTSEIPG